MIEWTLRNKIAVAAACTLFLGLAAWKAPGLTIDAVPDITNVQVVVNTKTRGLDPEKVELTVTQPIEYEMMGVPGLRDLRSISKFGLSQVTLVFDDGTDIYWARQQVTERLQTARGSLPPDLQPELAPITTGLGEVYMYSLTLKPDSALRAKDKTAQLLYLREIQDFEVRPLLRRIHGVADVDSTGGYKKELHVNLLPEKMVRHGLTFDRIRERLTGLGESSGGGTIDSEGQALIIKSAAPVESREQLEKLSLGIRYNGENVLLKELSNIREDGMPRMGGATLNGEEAVLGTVLMMTGGNGRQVSLDVEKALNTLELPADVQLTRLYSRGFLVNTVLKTVFKNLLEGALLVVAVLLLVLGNLRAAILVSLVIPLSMLGTTLCMQALNVSGNLMSLGAIDFGLVVDGAVVLIESLIAGFYLLSPGERVTLTRDQWVAARLKPVLRPVVFGMLMIMLVYLPILFLEGIEGKMFRPMAATVLMTLAWALVFTLFLVPVLASWLIPVPVSPTENTVKEHETRFFSGLRKLYSPLLPRLIVHPKRMLAGGLGLLVLSLLAFHRMGTDFIPQLDEGDLVINLTRDAGISLTESLRQQKEVEKATLQVPEVETVFSRLGTPESATDPMGVHLADTFVILKKDRSLWTVKTKDEVYEKLRGVIEALGLQQEIASTQPIEMRFNEMLEGSRADVSLRVIGPDLSYLVEKIDSLADLVKGVKGLESAEMDPLTALRKSRVVDITPKLGELSRLNIPLDQFNDTVAGFMQGVRVGQWVQGTRRFSIVLHLDEERRDRLDEIRKLPAVLPDGGSVPLENIATIRIEDKVTTIARTWGQRYAALSLNLQNRDVMGFVSDIKKILEKNPVRSDHRFSLGGQFNNLERARMRLWIIVPLTLLLIFFLLWREFASFKDAGIVFLCVPFAAFGGIFALFLRNIHLSLSAAVGFIALIGIALLNGIVLVTVFNQLKQTRPGLGLKERVLEGTLSRLRPVIMTAMVASIGFLPMAVNSGLGSEVQRPLATVVIGGILFSTVLTLILLPSVYLWVHGPRTTPRAGANRGPTPRSGSVSVP
jgi:cobalt-zinc-cadmium resistance protein CzcA